MQLGPREPVKKTGACGISCAICRFYIDGRCQCRTKEGPDPLGEATRGPCPIVQCASTRNIAFCARDCLDFPCQLLECTIPHRWSRLASSKSDASLPDWSPPNPLREPARHRSISQDSEMLRVFCLGQFRVFRGSVEIQDHHWGSGKGPTHKIKALFAFLLCRKGHGARKETLTDLLWPQQTDPKRASSSFHHALYHLRRALEPDLKAGAASSYIRCQGDRYFFSPLKPCWVDADVFASFSNRARALERDGDLAGAVAYWERAIDLYGGDYMAGIDPEYTECLVHDCCVTRRRRLRQLYLAASIRVARHRFNLGQYSLAIGYAQQALSIEPILEPAHRLVMECLFEIGCLDSALCQFRACEAELAWYEERAPSEQTQMLHKRLLEICQLD